MKISTTYSVDGVLNGDGSLENFVSDKMEINFDVSTPCMNTRFAAS